MSERIVFTLSLFLCLSPHTSAQGPRHVDADGDALDAQTVLARAKFDTARMTASTVASRRVAAVRLGYENQVRGFQSVDVTATAYRDWAARVEQAERAAFRTGEDTDSSLDALWEMAWIIEEMMQQRLLAGKGTSHEFNEARANRLDLEARWSEERVRKDRPRRAPQRLSPTDSEDHDLFRAKVAALQTTSRERRRQQIEAAKQALRSALSVFESGRMPLSTLLDYAYLDLQAEQSTRADRADSAVLSERAWELGRFTEELATQRFEARRLGRLDLALARYHLHDSEYTLLQVWAGRQPKASGPVDERFGDGSPELDTDRAQRRFKLSMMKAQEAARSRLAEARSGYRDALFVYRIGRGTLDPLLDLSKKLLESEQALTDSKAEKVRLLLQHWERAILLEDFVLGQFGKGRVSLIDLLACHEHRLALELLLIEERERK